MHAIFYRSPIEPLPVRLALLKFIFSCDLALNAIFYTDSQISENYNSPKNVILLSFTNNLIIILLSVLISYLILTFFIHLINSTIKIMSLFRNEEEKMKKNDKYIVEDKRKKEIKEEIEKIFKLFKIKVIILISVELLFMIFFWYYVIIFCHVYPSTQTSWLFDSFLSMLSRFIIDNIICLGLAKLYRIGVDSNFNCIYKFAMFLYEF